MSEKVIGSHEKLVENSDSLTETLKPRHFEVLELICENKEITTSEMAVKLGVLRQIIANRVKFLQEKDFLKRIGGDKGGC